MSNQRGRSAIGARSGTGREAAYAGVGDAAVKRATGKTWREWFRLLNAAGARKLPHREIARLLSKKHDCPPWWCQMVTVGYEQAHGLRDKYQTASGYRAGVSRTMPVSLKTLYAAWEDPAERTAWLGRRAITIRKATPRKSMRITWEDGRTLVVVNFLSKGAAKSQVAVQHSKLIGAEDVSRQKTFWAKALDVLAARLCR
jgi:hypothetical protein